VNDFSLVSCGRKHLLATISICFPLLFLIIPSSTKIQRKVGIFKKYFFLGHFVKIGAPIEKRNPVSVPDRSDLDV